MGKITNPTGPVPEGKLDQISVASLLEADPVESEHCSGTIQLKLSLERRKFATLKSMWQNSKYHPTHFLLFIGVHPNLADIQETTQDTVANNPPSIPLGEITQRVASTSWPQNVR